MKINTFSLFDHCHSSKTGKDTTLRSLMENENFQIFYFQNFRKKNQKVDFHENSQKFKCVQTVSSPQVLKI